MRRRLSNFAAAVSLVRCIAVMIQVLLALRKREQFEQRWVPAAWWSYR